MVGGGGGGVVVLLKRGFDPDLRHRWNGYWHCPSVRSEGQSTLFCLCHPLDPDDPVAD